MTPQHPQDSRNTAGICPCCPREEPCRRQHVVHCRDTIGKDSVRPGMTRGTSLRRRPYMKPLSSLLEQAPPSLVLDLMDTCRLETRHRDFLWRQGPQEIRQALLDCDGFLIGLTESQARDILTTGNVPLLCRLATLLPGRAQSPYRLSRATHEKLWRHLRGHPDMRIREALAGNDALPPAFAISFADRIRQHLPFCRTTFRDLRQEDVGLLLQGPYQRLVEALPFVPCIRDGNVRRTFIQGVLDHKDPVVRLELSGMARHRSHPLRPYGPMLFSDVPPEGSAARQDIFAMPVWSDHAVKGGASLRLATSGQHLPLTYRQLAALAASLAPCQREVADALLALEIPSLTETIIATACLSCEQMDSLWSSGGLEVRRALLGQQHFIQHLDAGQVRDILKADDVPMLRQLALCMREEVQPLLPGAAPLLDRLWLHLRQHPDMRVLQALAANSALPDAIAIPVGERLRLGLTLNSSAFWSLRLDEIPALLTVSTSALINLARHVEDIPNQEVRHAVLEALLSFPDPAVRMELAGYTTEDAAILTRLLADTDPGVRAAARENLEELRRIEEEEDEDEEEREDD